MSIQIVELYMKRLERIAAEKPTQANLKMLEQAKLHWFSKLPVVTTGWGDN